MIRRFLPALLALAACDTAAVTQASSAPTTPVTTTSPRIDLPLDLAAFDPCELLTAEDFKEIGKLAPPKPYQDNPNTCEFQIGQDLKVRIGLSGRAYDEAKTRLPEGAEAVNSGHSTWTACDSDGTTAWCAAIVAVADEQTLVIEVRRTPGNVVYLGTMIRNRISAILERLPSA